MLAIEALESALKAVNVSMLIAAVFFGSKLVQKAGKMSRLHFNQFE